MTESSSRLTRSIRRSLLAVLTTLALAQAASAAEISAFVSGAKPGETWGRGYGGMFTISLFNFVYGEVEGARQGSDAVLDAKMWSLSGKAYVGPSFGRLVPYAGLGTGFYRQTVTGDSDNGTFGSAFVGVKLRFPIGLVLRGEYQWLNLPDEAPVKLDKRYFVAAGLGF
jgi:hypothetical protein